VFTLPGCTNVFNVWKCVSNNLISRRCQYASYVELWTESYNRHQSVWRFFFLLNCYNLFTQTYTINIGCAVQTFRSLLSRIQTKTIKHQVSHVNFTIMYFPSQKTTCIYKLLRKIKAYTRILTQGGRQCTSQILYSFNKCSYRFIRKLCAGYLSKQAVEHKRILYSEVGYSLPTACLKLGSLIDKPRLKRLFIIIIIIIIIIYCNWVVTRWQWSLH
jgi:hypothetical protein